MSPIDLPLSRRRVLHIPLAYGLAVCTGAGQAQPADLAPLLANGVLEIIALPPAHIELYFADTLGPDTRAEAVAWVTRSAQATTAYLGRFPVNNPKITLLPVSGRGISSGLTFNGTPPSIRVQVGKDTTRAGFLDDWCGRRRAIDQVCQFQSDQVFSMKALVRSSSAQTAESDQTGTGANKHDVLERVFRGLVGEGAVVTQPEAVWVVHRLAELLDWSQPEITVDLVGDVG